MLLGSPSLYCEFDQVVVGWAIGIMASTTAIHIEDNVLVCGKEALKKKKAQERIEKKFWIGVRVEKKKLLEAELAEKMSAQIGKKKKLPITNLTLVLSAQRLMAKKKSIISMYFNSGKQSFINLSNSNAQSNLICSNLNSEEPKSFAISPKVRIVSNNTLSTSLSDDSEVIIIGSNNGTNGASSDNLDFKLGSLWEFFLSEDNLNDEEETLLLGAKIRKPNYDASRKFQMVKVAKLPWAKAVLATNKVLQMVKCRTS